MKYQTGQLFNGMHTITPPHVHTRAHTQTHPHAAFLQLKPVNLWTHTHWLTLHTSAGISPADDQRHRCTVYMNHS